MKKPDLTIFLNTFKENLELSAGKLSELRDDIYTLFLKNAELVPSRVLLLHSSFTKAGFEPKKEFCDFINMVNSHFDSSNEAQKDILNTLRAVCMMLNSDKNAISEFTKNILILEKSNEVEFLKNLIKNLSNDEYNKLCAKILSDLKSLEQKEQRAIILKFKEFFNINKEIYALFLELFDDFIKAKDLEMSVLCAQFILYEHKEFYNPTKINKTLSALFAKNNEKIENKNHTKKRIGLFGYKVHDNDDYAVFYSLCKMLLKDYEVYFYECSNEPVDALCMVEFLKLGVSFKAPIMELNKKIEIPVLSQIDMILKTAKNDEIDIAINLDLNSPLILNIFSHNIAQKMCNNFDISALSLPIDDIFLKQKFDNGYLEILRAQFDKNSKIMASFSRKLTSDEVLRILEFLNKNKDFIFITNSTQRFAKKPKNFIVLKDIDDNAYLRILDFYLCDTLDLNAKKVLANEKSVLFSNEELDIKNAKKADFWAKTQKDEKANFIKSFLSQIDA